MEFQGGGLFGCLCGAADVDFFEEEVFAPGYEALFDEGVDGGIAFVADLGAVCEELAYRDALDVPGGAGQG